MTKYSLIQLNTGCSPDKSYQILEKYIIKAVSNGSKLVCTPETTNIMEIRNSALFEKIYTEKEDPYLKKILQLAKDLNIWINIGSWIVKDKKNKASNRTFLINSDGLIHARYNKIHLFDVNLVESNEKYNESDIYLNGDSIVAVDTPFCKIGLSICYDLRFPELFRHLSNQGVDLICMPAAFTAVTGKAHWEYLIKSRAIENLVYFAASAQGGYHVSGRETYGHSTTVSYTHLRAHET